MTVHSGPNGKPGFFAIHGTLTVGQFLKQLLFWVGILFSLGVVAAVAERRFGTDPRVMTTLIGYPIASGFLFFIMGNYWALAVRRLRDIKGSDDRAMWLFAVVIPLSLLPLINLIFFIYLIFGSSRSNSQVRYERFSRYHGILIGLAITLTLGIGVKQYLAEHTLAKMSKQPLVGDFFVANLASMDLPACEGLPFAVVRVASVSKRGVNVEIGESCCEDYRCGTELLKYPFNVDLRQVLKPGELRRAYDRGYIVGGHRR